MGCQLADELGSGFGLHASASEHCIDILADGFAFRIFLASERCCTSAWPAASTIATRRMTKHLGWKLYKGCPEVPGSTSSQVD